MGGFKMEKCSECLRLELLLHESGLDYLAAANRYNTLLRTNLDHSWAAKALRVAKSANDERQRQLDTHAGTHAQPATMAASS
jgi:hypothetical protein